MKNVSFSAIVVLAFFFGLAPCITWGGQPPSHEVYEQRYLDRICPPEYPDNRVRLDSFLESDHGGGKMQRIFDGAAPESMNEITLLTDDNDAAVCRSFSQLHDKLINQKARLFEGGEAEYWHDLTFYKGGKFYFIVVGGGLLIQEDPDQPGKERIASSSVTGVNVFYRQDLELVPLNFMEDPAD